MSAMANSLRYGGPHGPKERLMTAPDKRFERRDLSSAINHGEIVHRLWSRLYLSAQHILLMCSICAFTCGPNTVGACGIWQTSPG